MSTPDYEAIRRFIEHEESKPKEIDFHDPSLEKARRKIYKGLGRHFGVIDWSETCFHWLQGFIAAALIGGIIALSVAPEVFVFIGGVAMGIVLLSIWRKIKNSWILKNQRKNDR